MNLRLTAFLGLLLTMEAAAQDIRIAPYASLQTQENEEIVALAFTGDGTLLLSGDSEGNISCWDLEKKILLTNAKLDDSPVFLAPISGDRMYVVVDERGKVALVDILKGATENSFQCKGKPLRVAIDAGKQFLAVATSDERLEIFDLTAMMPAGSIDAREKLDDILFLGFDRLAQQLVVIRKYGEVVSWNAATMKPMRELSLAGGELHGSKSVVNAAATNRASNLFAVALEEIALPKGGVMGGQNLVRNDMVLAYDWNTGVELKRIKTNWPVELMVLGPGNDHVCVINDEDKSITLIDLRKGELGSSVIMDMKPVALAVSEDNSWLAAGTKDGGISVWQMQFKEEASVKSSSVPALAGRIRSRSGKVPALKPGTPVKMAILGFEAKGVPAEYADICVNTMSNALADFDYITLVERRMIQKIVNEQEFQLSGLTEEEGVEVGKLSKADLVLLGSVGKLGSSVVISARLISVKTGKVMKGREVTCEECRDQDIYDAINMLVSTIAQ